MKVHSVRESAVILWDDGTEGERLAAYLVPEPSTVVDAPELRRFLQTSLPDYMVPSTFVPLEALPLTPTGKLDLQALRRPSGKRHEMEKAFTPPRTPIEEVLVEIWAKILDQKQVGVHDNFFDLGGHSLLAARMISRVSEIFRVKVPMYCLFEAPTVAGMSHVIVENEVKPGQTKKIVRILRKVKRMSAEEISRMLHEKRREEGQT